MKLSAMVGYKFFKKLDDGSIDLIRFVNARKYSDGRDPIEIVIRDENTGETKKVRSEYLKDYTPLIPDGLATFNIVTMQTEDRKSVRDVVVTGSKYLNLKIGDTLPFAVCRQSITDIFYNLLVSDESQMMVGLSVNQDNCPSNFDFRLMLATTGISYSDSINFYRTDTLDDILTMVKVSKFDEVLNDLYNKHVKASKNPNLSFKKSDKGWCSDLKTLLYQNNFSSDLNEMLGITEVEFNISNYIVHKILPGTDNDEYESLCDDLAKWLSSIYKVNIKDTTILEYDHDIDLADFNNSRYLLIRDNTKKLYLIVYTCSGEYLESDLEKESSKTDFTTQFRLKFYDKYNNSKNA